MAAVPSATIIGFTGTPIARTQYGEGAFKIFGVDDDLGYLAKEVARRHPPEIDPLRKREICHEQRYPGC